MDNCCTLYFLSTLSCQLAECLSENDLAALSADLSTLGSMLATILAHRALCAPPEAPAASGSTDSTGSNGTERQITIV